MLPLPYENISDNELLVAHVWKYDQRVISFFTQKVRSSRLSSHAIRGTIFSNVEGYIYMYNVIESGLTKCLELCCLWVGGVYFTMPFVLHRTNVTRIVCTACVGVETREYQTSDWFKYVVEEYIKDIQQNERVSITSYMQRVNRGCGVLVSLRVFTKIAQCIDEWSRL